MPDYSKGKIYTIRNRNDNKLIYVGSTTQSLSKRWGGHKNCGKTNRTSLLYSTIMNDWTDWYIELYEEYPCENKKLLNKREGDVIRLIATLNKNVAGRTYDEYLVENAERIKEKGKKYSIENAERIKQYRLESKVIYCMTSKKREAFLRANPDFTFIVFKNYHVT
jgi:hypothetical protein